MNTKLTLTIDRTVIDEAKKYAKLNGRSLSNIVENYLKLITVSSTQGKNNNNSITHSLIGSFENPMYNDNKEALQNALADKYLNEDKSAN